MRRAKGDNLGWSITLQFCDFCSQGVHAVADLSREFGAGGLAKRDDEQATGGAEVEVVLGWLETLGEGFVGDEDHRSTEGFGLSADCLLFFMNEGRYQHGASDGIFEPPGFLPGLLLFGKSSADFHRGLVWISEEEEIAVGFIFMVADFEFAHAPEELRILTPHSQAVGIETDVIKQAIEGTAPSERW